MKLKLLVLAGTWYLVVLRFCSCHFCFFLASVERNTVRAVACQFSLLRGGNDRLGVFILLAAVCLVRGNSKPEAAAGGE